MSGTVIVSLENAIKECVGRTSAKVYNSSDKRHGQEQIRIRGKRALPMCAGY